MDVQYAKRAVKAIKKLEASAKQRIRQGITGIPTNDIKTLQGHTESVQSAPDNRATQEDLIAHAAAVKEYRLGETISDTDIDWD